MTIAPYPSAGYPARPPEYQPLIVQAVAHLVAIGWRVEAHTPTQAVLVSGNRPNHLLHLGLTLATCGFWAPVWGLVALTVREHRMVVTADEWGRVVVTQS